MTDLTVFAFDTAAVRTLMIDDEPWFVAGDVANVLGYRNAPDMVRMLDEDEKGTQIVRTLGGDQEASIINESGLYACVLKSRRPEAKAFRKWITSEVLPALRRQGSYSVPGAAYAAQGHFLTGNPAHAADQLVSADRIFRSILRSSRSAGVPLPRALRRANDVAQARTGIDLLSELDAAELSGDDAAVFDPHGAHAFCEAWLAGGVPLPVVPCRSEDLFGAYAYWRQQAGELPGTLQRVVAAIVRRPDLRHRRARHEDATGATVMSGFVLPDCELMPPAGVTQFEWLTLRGRQFAEALDQWRAAEQ